MVLDVWMSTLVQFDSDFFAGLLKLATDDNGDFRDVHKHIWEQFFQFPLGGGVK